MSATASPARGGCLTRLLVDLVLFALVALPVGLLLPTEYVATGLGLVWPPEAFDLTSPGLLEGWRWVLAGVGGLLLVLLADVVRAVAGRARARRAAADQPAAKLLKAAQAKDHATVIEQAAIIGAQSGSEVVDELRAALECELNPAARQAVAAALFRVGRAVTAEASPRPPRL